MKEHERFINHAYHLAKSAVEKGNHPFGALLVLYGKVILKAENTVNSESDCTCHAELNLIKDFQKIKSNYPANEITLYTSTEPCAMCSGAIYWSGIRKIVFGCRAARLAEITGGNLAIDCELVFSHGKEKTEVLGPINEKEGLKLHKAFW